MSKNKSRKNKVNQVIDDQVDDAPKVDFDTWYVLRKDKIPTHHHKEIIKADFTARKLPKMCTIEQFDNALKKYGLKLD